MELQKPNARIWPSARFVEIPVLVGQICMADRVPKTKNGCHWGSSNMYLTLKRCGFLEAVEDALLPGGFFGRGEDLPWE